MATRSVRRFPALASLLAAGLPAQASQGRDADRAEPVDLAAAVRMLASEQAEERDRAMRRLVAAGAEALPHLRRVLAEPGPARPPVWVQGALYPSTPLLEESPVLAPFGAEAPQWEFLLRYPEVPRIRGDRIFTSLAFHPRVLATAVLTALSAEPADRIRELQPLLADRDVVVRLTAANGLGSLPAAVPALIRALDDPARAGAAAWALLRPTAKPGDAVLPVLLEIGTETAVSDRHRNAIALLAWLPDAEPSAPRLAELLGHPDPGIRRRAAFVLQTLGRRALPALRPALATGAGPRTCGALALFARTDAWTDADRESIARLATVSDPEIRRCAGEALRIHDAFTPEATLARLRPILKEMMRRSIRVPLPNGSPMRRRRVTTVFDGSYDFHSCVIAHWALLVMARLDGDAELRQEVLGRLDAKTLAAEVENLAALPDEWMIFPYDHGWFLMLLAELDRHQGDHRKVLPALRARLEQRVLTHLERTSLPEPPPRRQSRRQRPGAPEQPAGPAFLGHYRSWLMGYLLVQLSRPVGEGSAARLRALRAAKIEPNREAITGLRNPRSFDFLWLPAVLALIDRTRLDREAGFTPPPYRPGTLPPLPYTMPFNRVHILGQELSRIWPLALDASRGDAAAASAFAARVRDYVEHREITVGSFAGIAHWIPQFLWIGLWLRLGGA